MKSVFFLGSTVSCWEGELSERQRCWKRMDAYTWCNSRHNVTCKSWLIICGVCCCKTETDLKAAGLHINQITCSQTCPCVLHCLSHECRKRCTFCERSMKSTERLEVRMGGLPPVLFLAFIIHTSVHTHTLLQRVCDSPLLLLRQTLKGLSRTLLDLRMCAVFTPLVLFTLFLISIFISYTDYSLI